MQKKHLLAAVAAASLLSFSQGSQASVRQHRVPYQDQLEFDIPTLAPLAFTRFCLRYPDECRTGEPSTGIDKALSRQDPLNRADLAEVNRTVNRTIAPRRYVGAAAFDSWTVAPKAGDCNDYAITKRSLLRQKGWPLERLLLAEVQTPSGEHHLVLVVRLDGEDVVLDNLSGSIRNWSQTPYRWVRIQSAGSGQIWSTLRPVETDLLS